MSGETRAMKPEDVTRLVAERLNAGDAAGVAALYEPEAVLAYPADRPPSSYPARIEITISGCSASRARARPRPPAPLRPGHGRR